LVALFVMTVTLLTLREWRGLSARNVPEGWACLAVVV
jgi:hypothetical protein